jgi:hypothetical protein
VARKYNTEAVPNLELHDMRAYGGMEGKLLAVSNSTNA